MSAAILLSKHREFGFTEKISAKRQMSADGAADLRRRPAPSARTRHGRSHESRQIPCSSKRLRQRNGRFVRQHQSPHGL